MNKQVAQKPPKSIRDVVNGGLCIGCGLCESVTDGRVKMVMTGYGSLRPETVDTFTEAEQATLLSACPGPSVQPRVRCDGPVDPVWGQFTLMQFAWAADRDVRYRGATGGVLTALGIHLLRTKQVQFILHVGPDPKQPTRNRWQLSESPADVSANTGSRYEPASPLAGLSEALDRQQPFAIIAKPCDLSAVDNLSKTDPRIDTLCLFRLAMVCGGQSRMTKSVAILDALGVQEPDVTLFRHRGYGNPGLTRIETRDGGVFEKTYNELWADEAGWMPETRCKFCPDALGEASDIAAADVWPGGGPTGEDEGFNGIIVRSPAGEALIKGAADAGELVLGEPLTADMLNDMQPHQVSKKQRQLARYEGLRRCGLPAVNAHGLRLDVLSGDLSATEFEAEASGTAQRVRDGRVTEDF